MTYNIYIYSFIYFLFRFLFQEELKNMCLVRFSKLEDGLKALALKHNELLGGRNVKISFTKTKI